MADFSSHFLLNLSPIDGRYGHQTRDVASFFSEYSLFYYRLKVEVEYLIALNNHGLFSTPKLNQNQLEELRKIYTAYSIEDAQRVKEIEKTTNHDVKAVEYFIKEKLIAMGLDEYAEQVHFGLTSQDINNTAIPLSLKEANSFIILKTLHFLLDKLDEMAKQNAEVAMLARTHGQPATPTTLGKELYVFIERLSIQIIEITDYAFPAKFGGATGNFNAHAVAFPEVDWNEFANNFVGELGLRRSRTTTQIEHYDGLAKYFQTLSRINTILIDLCRDVWMYISMDYFKQTIKPGEVGSSAMPHKVNPIDFENAEGNLGFANAMFNHFAEKLPISRLQRDLSDSTVLRNIGVPIGHSYLAYQSIIRGLNKLTVNHTKIFDELNEHWEVLAEAIQTVLRRENYPNPYEKLKELTRKGSSIQEQDIKEFIQTLEIKDTVKQELLLLTPHNYIGIHPWNK